MPELPEVETIRRQLARRLVGARLTGVQKVEPAMLRDCVERDLHVQLPGRQFECVDRLGKYLIAKLTGGIFLTLHLGMTGQLLITSLEEDAASHPHARFVLMLEAEDGCSLGLEFRDSRKFGRVHLTMNGPAPRLVRLGPDAWKGGWDAMYLAGRLKGRKTAVKAILLNQEYLAGIGNIYADEILWWAGLAPMRPAGLLTEEEVGRLSDEIPRRLGEGVRLLGCSFSDYVDTEGRPGKFQEWLRAYGRQGQDCTRCGAKLTRAVVAGRGTVYCRVCQC